MTVPATLAFAIDLLMGHHPELTPEELCDQLRARNWDIDVEAVTAHVAQRSARATVPEADAVPVAPVPAALRRTRDRGSWHVQPEPSEKLALQGIELDEIPEELAAAVRDFGAGPDLFDPPSPPSSTMSAEFEDALQEISSALTAEITANSELAADRRVALRSGHLLSRGSNGFTARWEMDIDIPVVDGATVKLTSQSVVADAEVVQMAGTSITLFVAATEKLLDEEVLLVLDASFLLELRRAYVRRLLKGDATLDSTAALGFMKDPLPTAHSGDYQAPGLNAEQAAFVDRALHPGTTWLWGPPGTGKTTTLAHLLHVLRRKRLRTLFVSNTNAAVDTAILKFLDGIDGARLGEIVRIGNPSSVGIAGRQETPVLIDEIAAASGLEAGAHLAACRKQINKLKTENAKRILSMKDPVAARDRGWLGTPDMDYFELLQVREASGTEALLDQTEGEIGRLVEQRRNLESLVSLIKREIVDRGRTVFATVHQTYLNALEGQRFDVVVIDEASMVSSDLVAIAAGLGTGHTIIAGDFRQLSPISAATSVAAERWLRVSPFDKAGVASRVREGTVPPNLTALTTQHRMRPSIERVIGSSFYREVGLRSGESIATRPGGRPTPIDDELVFVNTSGLRPWMTRRNGRYSRLNVLHAQVIDAIAGQVNGGSSFGAVSPFAPQARLLESLVSSREGHAASTVHRFQGGERDVMAWDMTEGRAGATRVNRWFDATHADEEGARLINVAMSRARDQLYVVADMDRARSGCSDRSVVRRVLDVVQAEGTTVSAVDVLRSSTGRTTAHRTDEQHPLVAALTRDEEWVVVYSAEPPRSIDPAIELEIALAVRAGRSVYVRCGVPDRESQRASLAQLQLIGCHVQLVRPCRENIVLTPSTVISSSGSLISPGTTQLWLHTVDVGFAGTALRLVSRRGDANPVNGESDPLCPSGHPLLVDHGREHDFRGRCLTCNGDVTENVRTARSRTRGAARSAARCLSCGHEFDATGWCKC